MEHEHYHNPDDQELYNLGWTMAEQDHGSNLQTVWPWYEYDSDPFTTGYIDSCAWQDTHHSTSVLHL